MKVYAHVLSFLVLFSTTQAKVNKLFPQEPEGKDSRELYYSDYCQNSYCPNPCKKGYYGGRKLEGEVPEDTVENDEARELYYYGYYKDLYHPHCYFYGHYGGRRLEEVEGVEDFEGVEGNDHTRQLEEPASLQDPEGYYSYKYNQKFLQCDDFGGCYEQHCPAYLWWDDCAQVCNYPGAVLYQIYYGKIDYYGECIHYDD